MKKIILICGFQGTGKSTFSKELSNRLPTAYFLDADEFFTTQEKIPDDINKLSREERTKRREKYITSKTSEIRRLLDLHDTVITDGLFTHKRDRLFVKELAKREKVQLVIIRISCPKDIVKKRIFAQEEHILKPEKRWNSYLRTVEEWEPIEENHIEIDNSTNIDYNTIVDMMNKKL